MFGKNICLHFSEGCLKFSTVGMKLAYNLSPLIILCLKGCSLEKLCLFMNLFQLFHSPNVLGTQCYQAEWFSYFMFDFSNL